MCVRQLVPKEQDTDRITKASELADKLNNFFRNSDTGYEDMFPDVKEKREPEWDSGQVGWIYVSKEDALKEFDADKMTRRHPAESGRTDAQRSRRL